MITGSVGSSSWSDDVAQQLGHLQVEQDDVGLILWRDGQGCGAGGGEAHGVAEISQCIVEHRGDVALVFDDQDASKWERHGSETIVPSERVYGVSGKTRHVDGRHRDASHRDAHPSVAGLRQYADQHSI
jgi:hypothetical protein